MKIAHPVMDQRGAGILALLLAIVLVWSLVGCETVRPLCRHIVLSQAAAFRDAGYETETWLIKNPQTVDGFAFHEAVRVRKPGEDWRWVEQDRTMYCTTDKQPDGYLLRIIE